MAVVKAYLDFMFREPSRVNTSVHEVRKDIFFLAVAYSFMFISLCFTIPRLVKHFYPKFYQELPEKRREEIPTYVSCMAHHLVVVPLGFWMIYKDYNRTPEEYLNFNYAVADSDIIPYCFGYLFGDMLFFCIGEIMKGKYDVFLHHALSFALIYLVINCPGNVNRFIAHVIICEFSQIFFISAWFLRLIGSTNTTLITGLEITFAIAFFCVRIVNLPIATWRILDLAGDLLPIARAVLWPIIGLQFFWFSKILGGVMERMGLKAARKKDNKVKKDA